MFPNPFKTGAAPVPLALTPRACLGLLRNAFDGGRLLLGLTFIMVIVHITLIGKSDPSDASVRASLYVSMICSALLLTATLQQVASTSLLRSGGDKGVTFYSGMLMLVSLLLIGLMSVPLMLLGYAKGARASTAKRWAGWTIGGHVVMLLFLGFMMYIRQTQLLVKMDRFDPSDKPEWKEPPTAREVRIAEMMRDVGLEVGESDGVSERMLVAHIGLDPDRSHSLAEITLAVNEKIKDRKAEAFRKAALQWTAKEAAKTPNLPRSSRRSNDIEAYVAFLKTQSRLTQDQEAFLRRHEKMQSNRRAVEAARRAAEQAEADRITRERAQMIAAENEDDDEEIARTASPSTRRARRQAEADRIARERAQMIAAENEDDDEDDAKGTVLGQ